MDGEAGILGVDLVLDPSPQDLPRVRSDAALKVIDGIENRTISSARYSVA